MGWERVFLGKSSTFHGTFGWRASGPVVGTDDGGGRSGGGLEGGRGGGVVELGREGWVRLGWVKLGLGWVRLG
jgi:hypothetical protein